MIRWILLLQEFDLTIKDKKGVENVVADHLSRLTFDSHPESPPIVETFPDEQLLAIDTLPWYTDIVNYLATGEIPSHWSLVDKKRFLALAQQFHFDDPYLFKYCADQVIRRCAPNEDIPYILASCHAEACGGHFLSQKTAKKVLHSGFYWPSLFKDSHVFCTQCPHCQMLGSISKRNAMPQTPILTIEIFDCWGIDFMGPFPSSNQFEYILLAVEYVSKWVEAIPTRRNDHRTVISFLKENILSRFGTPKALISDQGKHFCNKPFESLMKKYGVNHKVALAYHP